MMLTSEIVVQAPFTKDQASDTTDKQTISRALASAGELQPTVCGHYHILERQPWTLSPPRNTAQPMRKLLLEAFPLEL